MQDRRGTSRLIVAVVATCIASLALGLAPSPARASYYEDGVSFSSVIQRGSVPYVLKVTAVEAMGYTFRLDVSISKVRDPAGPTALRQLQTWNFDLREGEFTRDGDTYRIDAGSDEGPFRIKVVIERPRDESCSERQQLFVTRPDDGAFRIETGNAQFGTITELPACGNPYSHASGQLPPPPPCPLPGAELQSGPLNLKERRDGETVRIHLYQSERRTISGQEVVWFVRLSGTVPAKRFWLAPRLRGATFAARGAPWLSGTARFTATRPRQTGEWYDCRGGREGRTTSRRGRLSGDLTLSVIGYEDRPIQDRHALALRSWVRPRG